MNRTLTDERIPDIGLGTWQNTDPDQCKQTVRNALDIGYRHVDTAQLYENEEAVGNGISDAGCSREDVYLATKIDFKNLKPDDVKSSTEESLRKLQTPYVDLLYVHWPAGEYDVRKTLGAFAELKQEEKIRHVGVSNYTIPLMEEAREVIDVSITANQIEIHPYLPQDELREYLKNHDVLTVAYSPFRHGTIFDDEVITEISSDLNVSPAQVVLAWLLEKDGVITIPKATTKEHLLDNFKALEFELSNDAISKIDSINRRDRYIDPPFAPDW